VRKLVVAVADKTGGIVVEATHNGAVVFAADKLEQALLPGYTNEAIVLHAGTVVKSAK
jgi:hypothetical protein